MPRITSKGQITIPQDIRNKFGFLPGMEIEVIVEGNKALIVKRRREDRFNEWLGRGRKKRVKRKPTGWSMVFEEERNNNN